MPLLWPFHDVAGFGQDLFPAASLMVSCRLPVSRRKAAVPAARVKTLRTAAGAASTSTLRQSMAAAARFCVGLPPEDLRRRRYGASSSIMITAGAAAKMSSQTCLPGLVPAAPLRFIRAQASGPSWRAVSPHSV